MRFLSLCVLLLGVLAMPAAAQTSTIDGEWRNPSNSVHFRAHACGDGRLCGTITWASEKAKADARRGGTEQLIGLELFRNMRRDGNVWRGQVFVPDIRRTFSGSIEPIDSRTVIGKGCLLGRILCKSQRWTRVG